MKPKRNIDELKFQCRCVVERKWGKNYYENP